MKALLVRHQAIKRTFIFLQITLFVLFFGNTLVAKEMRDISQDELLKGIQAKSFALILDVRTVGEFKQGHISGAVNIPHLELQGRLAEIAKFKNKEIVIYCRSGRRAVIAANFLNRAGYHKLLHLRGDMIGWYYSKHPLVK